MHTSLSYTTMSSSQGASTHNDQQRTSIDQLLELSKKGKINKALYEQLAAELSRFPDLQAYDLLQRLEVKTVLQGFGGFSDVYHGMLKVDSGQTTIDPGNGASSPSDPQLQVKVAVKQLRMFATLGSEEDPKKAAKGLVRELRIWKGLTGKHDNILPCEGFTVFGELLCFVSKWMANGDIRAYLSKYPNANKAFIVQGVASGLNYLHSQCIVHSDLKSGNILIDDNGQPVLSDFGTSRVLVDNGTLGATASQKGSYRWMAIELLHVPENGYGSSNYSVHTREADVWAFGMVIYAIITGNDPFHGLNDTQVILAITKYKLPKMSIVDEHHTPRFSLLWDLCQRCWAKNPSERPTMEAILCRLQVANIEPVAFVAERLSPSVTILQKLSQSEPHYSPIVFALSTLQHYDLRERVQITDLRGFGGFFDTYTGILTVDSDPPLSSGVSPTTLKVSVRRLRVPLAPQGGGLNSVKSLFRELRIWTSLSHDNILACLGFAVFDDGVLCLISPWMENGNIQEYIAQHPNTDRKNWVCGVASGLKYLHSVGIIHADIRSGNVFVNDSGRPVICGISTSRLVVDDMTLTGTSSLKGAVRWMSIELIMVLSDEFEDCEHPFHTKASDVWAFGMLVYEIITGILPFHTLKHNNKVIEAITGGITPERPSEGEERVRDFDFLWKLCEQCWARNPTDRPTMEKNLDRLEGRGVELSLDCEFEASSVAVTCVAFSPVDTRRLVTSSHDNDVIIWTTHGKEVKERLCLIGHTKSVSSVVWSTDGSFLVSGSLDKSIRKWNISIGKCEIVAEVPHQVHAIALSPDDEFIVFGGVDSSLYVYDVPTMARILGPLSGHKGNVLTVAYSQDGRHIVSGSRDKSIIVWDSKTGAKLSGPIMHSGVIQSLSHSPLGGTFVTGSFDTITIWDAKSFEPFHRALSAHGGRVKSVHYSPDGRFVLSASADGTLKVWNVESGKVVVELPKHDCSVEAVSFSSDGEWAASGDSDGMVRIWKVDL